MLSDARPTHCSTGQGKKAPLLFSAALQTSLTCLCPCSYTYGDLLFIQVCSDPTQSTAARFRAKCSLYCSVLLCKTSSQQAVCHCSYTYGDLLFIQVCSDPTQSTAARFRAKCSLYCSVLLCKTSSQQAVCHCSYTYGDLLFVQLCSDLATKHCSKVQGKMQFPLFCAALQNRLTAGSVSLQLHLWRSALHTGVQ